MVLTYFTTSFLYLTRVFSIVQSITRIPHTILLLTLPIHYAERKGRRKRNEVDNHIKKSLNLLSRNYKAGLLFFMRDLLFFLWCLYFRTYTKILNKSFWIINLLGRNDTNLCCKTKQGRLVRRSRRGSVEVLCTYICSSSSLQLPCQVGQWVASRATLKTGSFFFKCINYDMASLLNKIKKEVKREEFLS